MVDALHIHHIELHDEQVAVDKTYHATPPMTSFHVRMTGPWRGILEIFVSLTQKIFKLIRPAFPDGFTLANPGHRLYMATAGDFPPSDRWEAPLLATLSPLSLAMIYYVRIPNPLAFCLCLCLCLSP